MNESDPLAATGQHQTDADSSARPNSVMPETIGRYRIERLLGQGGFGMVFLARDESLDRLVAIKVPYPDLVNEPGQGKMYLAEAQVVASLDHPNIVPVFDVGSTEQHPFFFVSKFVDGDTLAGRIRETRLTYLESAGLVATIAKALHHAHKKGLVHRDVKPGNILIDSEGVPYLADFGLALRDVDVGKGQRFYAGTAAYMSPEQARGEGHRVDGRSDVYSLGVVLYELLALRRPFRGETQAEVIKKITSLDPRPPRQLFDAIPKELERICLRAMAKRSSDRYTTAKDLADELDGYCSELTVTLQKADEELSFSLSSGPPSSGPPSTQKSVPSTAASTAASWAEQPISIVPQGLRSFDHHDADFFLELLPGARDRNGTPESIRFWKTRIEELDADQTFKVGLLYGPSGCGKSSLVKAGLLPQLSGEVVPLYVEATESDTETRLLSGLQKICPGLADGIRLTDAIALIRRREVVHNGQKILIVLDQFEQWLHGGQNDEVAELTTALRQCDGSHVQAILMVRDDFWMAATRIMRALEVPLVEGENSAAVDLFQIRHAQKVLVAFGRAFGDLTQNGPLPKEEAQFIEAAVAELAEDGKVISVRLSLFAEMIKGKPWTTATLRTVGGAAGVGSTFLEETFSAKTAPPLHRYHQKAVRNILKALLPDSGTDIKGHMRSRDELLELSGYENNPSDFDAVIQILDTEVRLITPTDPSGEAEKDTTPAADARYYQLTHDYLVSALQDWLTRKQRETRRGRCELQLAEMTSLWSHKPVAKHLPSCWEWLKFVCMTNHKQWPESQRRMMRAAARKNLIWLTGAAVLFLLIGWGTRQTIGRLQATAKVERLKTADTNNLTAIIKEFDGYYSWAESDLRQLAHDEGSPDHQQRARLALMSIDDTQVDALKDDLLRAEPPTLLVLREGLYGHRKQLIEWLWQHLEDDQQKSSIRFRAAIALASYSPPDQEEVASRWKPHIELVSKQLLETAISRPSYYESLQTGLKSIKELLLDSLSDAYIDEDRARRSVAMSLMVDYFRSDSAILIDMLLNSDAEQFQVVFPLIEPSRDSALRTFALETSGSRLDDTDSLIERMRQAKRLANAAVAAAKLGSPDMAWRRLGTTENPEARSWTVHGLKALGVPIADLVARLKAEDNPIARQALLHALGEYELGSLSRSGRDEILTELEDLFRSDGDAGIHAATEWLLRQWGQEEILNRSLSGNDPFPADDSRQWYRSRSGHGMVVLDGRDVNGISRRFALSDKEVTADEFKRFWDRPWNYRKLAVSMDCPAQVVNWYDAISYCQWLNEKEGIPKEQWCYPEFHRNDKGLPRFVADVTKTGYRLPTTAEWQWAARAGQRHTRYHFGDNIKLLLRYGWFSENSQDHSHPVGRLKPNDFGLFDMLGNITEWHADLVLDDRVELSGGSYGTIPETFDPSPGPALPATKYNSYGFRLARTLPPEEKKD